MFIFIVITVLNIVGTGCQSENVTISIDKSEVMLGDKVTLTCTYYGNRTESGILWFNGSDTTGLLYLPGCTKVSTPSSFYDTGRILPTCNSSSNVYTLTITVNAYDFGSEWCCSFILTPNVRCGSNTKITALTTTTTTSTSTTTTTTITVTSSSLSSTSMSSTASSATTDNKSTKPTINGSTASATSSTFISTSPTPVLIHNETNTTSTSRSPTGSTVSATRSTSASTNSTTSEPTTTNKTSTGNNGTKSNISETDIKVIVPAVVVPCGLLIIVALVLIVVFCVRRKARKNVRESPDGMAIHDKGNNIDGWKQSLGHGKVTDNIDTVYTTPDGFIIYPGPAAVSTARSYKDKKYPGVTDQYSRPNHGTHHHQADYIPSTHTSARAYTHRGKKHHVVTDQYSRPYPGNYDNQTAYFPSTYKSARIYAQKGKTYEGHQTVSNLMATSRLAYGQTAYYPHTGYYGQSGQDVYCSGGGKYSYGQRSKSHHDHNGRKQQRDYYSQYEMADYRGDITGYRHTKQDTAFYY